MKLKSLHGLGQMVDLRRADTSLVLTPDERLAARNENRQLQAKRDLLARGLAPMPIGEAHVPESVAKQFTYVRGW